MKKSTKIWIIIASIFVVLGTAIFAGAMFAYDWDFSKLSTVNYATNTYEVAEDFESIFVDSDMTDITFALTEDEVCRVVCDETEKIKYSVVVKDGMLTISTNDMRKWHDHIGIYLSSPQMTVYLPKNKYVGLFIETDTGDIFIPKEFSFNTIEIDGDTSDVDCFASALEEVKAEVDTGYVKMSETTANRVNLSAATGSIILNSVTVQSIIDVETDTGKIKLTNIKCLDLYAENNTGNINLENVIASGKFSIKANTGDVNFDSCDAQEIFVETDTGDVKGSLLTDKVFIAKSDIGRINVPKTITGGRCEITTDTGNIILEIK